MHNNEIHGDYIQYGPLHIKTKLTDDVVNRLEEISNMQRGNMEYDARSSLAGVLDEEYKFDENQTNEIAQILHPWMEFYMNVLTGTYNIDTANQLHSFCEMYNVQPVINCDSVWVNYQQKGNYNPVHNHSGGFSYVLYLQTPQEMYNEERITRSNPPGSITFFNKLGKTVAHHQTSKTKEEEWLGIQTKLFAEQIAICFTPERGDMFIFPSWLNHAVEGFNGDYERVSIAGNMTLEMRELSNG
jgi:hypothetical protein